MNYGGNFLKKNIFTVIDLILDFIGQLFLGLLHLRYIHCVGYEIVKSSLTLKYFKCNISGAIVYSEEDTKNPNERYTIFSDVGITNLAKQKI